MWWLYFAHEHAALFTRSARWTFGVGYGHYLVFASAAATGAALAAAVDLVQGQADSSSRAVGLGVTVAVAVYLWCVTALDAAGGASRSETLVGAAGGVLVVAVALVDPPVGTTVLVTGLVLAAVVTHHVWAGPAPRERWPRDRTDRGHSTGRSRPLSTS